MAAAVRRRVGPCSPVAAPGRVSAATLAARRRNRRNYPFRCGMRAVDAVPASAINQHRAAAECRGGRSLHMQVSVESTGNLERRMTFRLPAERLETQVGGRLREIARTARIKGFRPGKVPTKVIEQRFGQQVRAEVLDGLLRESFDSAVREQRAAHRRQPADRAGAERRRRRAGLRRHLRGGAGLRRHRRRQAQRGPPHRRGQRRRHRRDDRQPAPAAPQLEPGRRVPRRTATRSTLETWSQAGDERLPAEGVEQRRHRDRFRRDVRRRSKRRWSA